MQSDNPCNICSHDKCDFCVLNRCYEPDVYCKVDSCMLNYEGECIMGFSNDCGCRADAENERLPDEEYEDA